MRYYIKTNEEDKIILTTSTSLEMMGYIEVSEDVFNSIEFNKYEYQYTNGKAEIIGEVEINEEPILLSRDVGMDCLERKLNLIMEHLGINV